MHQFPKRAETPSAGFSRDIIRTFAKLPALDGASGRITRQRVTLRPSTPASLDSPTSVAPAARLLLDGGVRVDTPTAAPVSSPHYHRGSSSSPAFVTEMEHFIDKELRLLAKAAPCLDPADRVGVFQHAARHIVGAFSHFSPLLQRIFDEYDAFVDHAKRSMTVLLQERALHDARERAQAEEIAQQRTRLDEYIAREAERQTMLQSRLTQHPTATLLAERLDMCERKLAQERQLRAVIEGRLQQSGALSTQFEEALRTMDANYQKIVDDKNIEILRLSRAATAQVDEYARAERCSRERYAKLEDTVTACEIELAALQQKCSMQGERIRHFESRVAINAGRYSELVESHGILEARLEKLNKPTSTLLSHDPTLTPRPSKKDIVAVASQLGSISQFNSTQAIIDALLECVTNTAARANEAERMHCAVRATTLATLSAFKKQLADKARGVTTRDVAVNTEQRVQ
jgi:hypothetical protein